jgi:hypothetical protein
MAGWGLAADRESVAGEELRSDLFKYFVYILSAPFIAMIAFSHMVIADYTNPHALRSVAFSVGFISDTVVETIMGKARSISRLLHPRPQRVRWLSPGGLTRAPAPSRLPRL